MMLTRLSNRLRSAAGLAVAIQLMTSAALAAAPKAEMETGARFRINAADTAQIAVGEYHALLLRPDGSLWGWGSNKDGQLSLGNDAELQALGVANATGRYLPTLLGTGYLQVSADGQHTLALRADGSLWAWGSNSHGQLGDGTVRNRYRPARIGDGYVRVAAGPAQSFAIDRDGALWAWGQNDYGQLGDGTRLSRERPVRIGEGFTDVASGGSHTVALKGDGSLWAWGDNGFGQFGDGTVTPRDAANQRRVPARVGDGYRAIAATWLFTAAIKNDGSLWTWGENLRGRIGDGSGKDRASPVRVGHGFAQVAVRGHVLALKTDGALWTWGYNGHGELGDGNASEDRNMPALVDQEFSAIAAGDFCSIAIKDDGSIWTWGSESDGLLGDGSRTSRNRPARITLPAPRMDIR